MLPIVLGLVGLLLGAAEGGALLGAFSGAALGLVLTMRASTKLLQAQCQQLQAELATQSSSLESLQRRVQQLAGVERSPTAAPVAITPQTTPSVAESVGLSPDAEVVAPGTAPADGALEQTNLDPPVSVPSTFESAASEPRPGAGSEQPRDATASASSATAFEAGTKDSSRTYPLDRVEKAVREFLFGGNTIVRVGTLVLLVGVVLLLKWAADNAQFPIEVRLSMAALVGVGLTAIGYRTRQNRPGFAATLQGGGVATLYLTIFFSFRVYELLPGALAFALLAGLSLFSCTLAALQRSMPLIFIGAIGGFLAPVLASTGQGDHVALFSYYLLLNLAVLGIAVHQLWRPVALLGFLFTFGIGSTWGVLRYEADNFTSTQPFLTLFWLLFAATPVLMRLWSRRTSSRTGTWPGVDNTLTFGTPLVVLVLQGALLADNPLGMAFAVVSYGLAYVAAAWLLRRHDPSYAIQIESFLVIGVGLGTLAIPYALGDHNLTGAAWALEGAGIYWVGLRQGRTRSQVAGVLLQGLAGAALVLGMQSSGIGFGGTSSPGEATTRALAAALSLFSCYVISWLASRHRERVPMTWRPLQVLLFLGLLLSVRIGLQTLAEQVGAESLLGAQLAGVALLAIVLELVSGRLSYTVGRVPALAIFVLTPLVVGWCLLNPARDPLSRGLWMAWPLLFGSMWLSLRRFVPVAPRKLEYAFAPALWSLVLWCALEAYTLCSRVEQLGHGWPHAAFISVLALSLATLTLLRHSNVWPLGAHRTAVLGPATLGLLITTLTALTLQVILSAGHSDPLPYVPLVNALDLTHVFAIMAAAAYLHLADPNPERHRASAKKVITAGVAFFAFNGMLGRAVHQLADVPHDLGALWQSATMQWVLSGAWTVLTVALMFIASKRQWRTVWIAAGSLMAVTVLKLFLVDLSRESTIARIVTFMAVGAALLLVGYVSPLPPRATPNKPNEPSPPDNPAKADETENPSATTPSSAPQQ